MGYAKINNTDLNNKIEEISMDYMGYLHENIFPGICPTYDYPTEYRPFLNFALGSCLVHNKYIKEYKIKKACYDYLTETYYYVVQNKGYISYCFIVYKEKINNFVLYNRIFNEELKPFSNDKDRFKCETIKDIVQYHQLPYVCEIPHLYKRITRTL